MPALIRCLTLAGALALAAPVAPALAQNPEVHIYTMGRARIGVMVDMKPNAETDRWGARLADVVEEGPAAKAGLEQGDIVTRFNTTALGGLPAEDEASGPGARLVELARALAPGDTVRVEYRRGDRTRNTTLVAERAQAPAMAGAFSMSPRAFRFDMDDFEGMAEFEPGQFGGLMRLARGLGGLRLAQMNAGLGDYFGTSTGLLLLEAPADSTMPLRAGDVILRIDDRAPKDVAHARRILGSYAGGETVELRVMRQRREQTVRWTVPERAAGTLRWREPAPPARPRAPVSPSRS